MKPLKRLGLVVVLALVVIQFFHPAKNEPAGTTPSPTDITVYGAIPGDVNTILKKACNDCHSNTTVYPWYNNIQPVAWWLNNHITGGKRHLNFNDFTSRSVARQYKRMQDCIDEVKEGDMPLDSYLWIHKDAKLTDTEKQTLYNWFNTVRDSIKARYPADSLVMPERPKKG
jgi:hypothetical protein